MWHCMTKKQKKKEVLKSQKGFSQRMPWSHSKVSGDGKSREGEPGGENQVFLVILSSTPALLGFFFFFCRLTLKDRKLSIN